MTLIVLFLFLEASRICQTRYDQKLQWNSINRTVNWGVYPTLSGVIWDGQACRKTIWIFHVHATNHDAEEVFFPSQEHFTIAVNKFSEKSTYLADSSLDFCKWVESVVLILYSSCLLPVQNPWYSQMLPQSRCHTGTEVYKTFQDN